MKKGLIFFLLIFLQGLLYAQIVITGKVTTSQNEPLEGASVYLNNTTIGTITNAEGEFSLPVKKGNYDLIVSFIGFNSFQTTINDKNQKINFHIQLTPDTTLLNEVEIKETVYDKDWKYNLQRFKQALLGRSKVADNCVITNEKDLHFDYNASTNTLTALAKKPLVIKNKELGYLITYDLVNFTLTSQHLVFSGYAQYKNLRKSVSKKWEKNRRIAYNGSRMNFLRCLLNQNLKDEGFFVNQFKRLENPNRPSEEKIKLAQELVKLHGNINFSQEITIPKTPLDSALVVLKNARLPKYQDFLYKTDVPYSEMITATTTPLLSFENFLSITYTKEIEEDNFLKGRFGQRKKQSGVQTSSIVLLDGPVEIYTTGIVSNPTSVFNEGYWAFKALANMLPLDYSPLKKE
ncbi:carboxypeptidase-like regulatory domain-containing protein [Tenacibaculum sp. TC6]|uniref:carboxypeptidase-like regulatory domain-containing protein n=1 Tax=Tenacibaculum sp. TC6 TaxID=3423223 RepID=UPI003D36BEBC